MSKERGLVLVRIVCAACGNRTIGSVTRRGSSLIYEHHAKHAPYRYVGDLSGDRVPAWWCKKHGIVPTLTADVIVAAGRGTPGHPAIIRVAPPTPT